MNGYGENVITHAMKPDRSSGYFLSSPLDTSFNLIYYYYYSC